MPQMAPINWILLFLIFNATVFMIIVKLYFLPSLSFLSSFRASRPSTNSNNPVVLLNNSWKW